MPEQVEEAVRAVRAATSATVGIHTHNDAGVALASALAAIRAGAGHAQGTINGVGERCGNMDLLPLVANLRLKYGIDCLRGDTLARLTMTSRAVYEIANQTSCPASRTWAPARSPTRAACTSTPCRRTRAPTSTSTRRGGQRAQDPRERAQRREQHRRQERREVRDRRGKETLRRVLGRVQDLEHEGFQFESAEASFELLLRREIGRHRAFWQLDNYRVSITRFGEGPPRAEATVKLHVGDAVEHRVAESDGPVDALNKALRLALRAHLPAIGDVHLSDYKVRVINGRQETAAVVRVVIEFTRRRADGSTELFGTIGVNGNILDASWQALADAYEYHLLHVDEGM
jgi:2-isopropylmalate synthase